MIRNIHAALLGLALLPLAGLAQTLTNTNPVAAVQSYPDRIHYEAAVRSYKRGFNDHAREQFQLAAEWGNKNAQFNLALMHFSGIGVAADKILGTAWALLADERGDGRFRATRLEMMQLLAPEERQRAITRANELKTSYGDFQALEKRAKWVRKQKRELTGSRTGALASAVRINLPDGRFAGRGDEYLAYIQTFEQELFDVVTSVEYKDFEVIEPTPED